jgi:hypothetical protein
METESLAQHYKRMLKRKTARSRRKASGGLEAGAKSAVEDDFFSDDVVDEHVEETRKELRRIVKEFLDDDPELKEIADQIAKSGKDALRAVGDEDNRKLADPGVVSALEVIVRTDGSRPSFMVRNGAPDPTTSPVGDWADELEDQADALRHAIQCIGRIDDPGGAQGFQGTGILVGKNVIITNRHVLQAISSGRQHADGSWQLKPNISIDFGHEFRGRESVGPRKVVEVLFAGSKEINPVSIDHAKLDLALLELEPGNGQAPKPLPLELAPDWGQPDTIIFICGYPGNPGAGAETASLLERLFRSTYGCKRLAPGYVTKKASDLPAGPRNWTLAHDGTTLGGNSGSGVFVMGRGTIAAGLHYGGRRSDPRENWCHILGLTLDETDGHSTKTLRECLDDAGVEFVDSLATA